MITADDFMRFPVEDRAVALDTFREHLARLLLAEAAMVLREKLPSAAWIRVRMPMGVSLHLPNDVEVVSIRDLGGYALGKIGPVAARQVNALLREANLVHPNLLDPTAAPGAVVPVHLPAAPTAEAVS